MHVFPKCFSPVWLLETPWTAALQAPLSMGFSRPEYWSELPCHPPGDPPNPGMQPKYSTYIILFTQAKKKKKKSEEVRQL